MRISLGVAAVVLLAVGLYVALRWWPPDTPPIPGARICPYQQVIVDLPTPGACPQAPDARIARQMRDRRCVYAPMTTDPDFYGKMNRRGLGRAARDCIVGISQASTLTSNAKQAIVDRFKELAGLPTAAPAGTTVRIAIVDSAAEPAPPNNEPDTDESQHAFAVGSAAAAAVCGDTCPANAPLQIRSYQALDMLASGSPPVRYGSWTSLARAITEAVDDAVKDEVPLIVNLSIGWDPMWGSDPNEAGPDEVYIALKYALDNGAWVFASAGNRGDSTSGLMLPAAWEGDTALDGDDRFRAVGAIAKPGALLAIGRDGGVAGLVAMGAHFVADAPAGATDCGREVWSGTSIATALVSGYGARVLIQEGDLTSALASITPTTFPGAVTARVVRPCTGSTCADTNWTVPSILCGTTAPTSNSPSWVAPPSWTFLTPGTEVWPQPPRPQCPVCLCRNTTTLETRWGGIVASQTARIVFNNTTGSQASSITVPTLPPPQGHTITVSSPNYDSSCNAPSARAAHTERVGSQYPLPPWSEIMMLP